MEASARGASEWVYSGVWSVLTGVFRVPRSAPELPLPSSGVIRALRPCAGWLTYRKIAFWIACLVLDVALLVAWIALYSEHPRVALWLLIPWLIVVIVPDIVAYVAVHLRYDTTWYVLSDRSMRIRRGVWVIHETTITFDNIQNVRITQGPLQRMLKFSDVVVETAGGGGGAHAGAATGGFHTGLLEGIEDPVAMRELIMERVRASRSAGLGDDARSAAGTPTVDRWSPAHVEALRSIARETALLKSRLE